MKRLETIRNDDMFPACFLHEVKTDRTSDDIKPAVDIHFITVNKANIMEIPDAHLTDEVRGKNSLRYEEYIDSVTEDADEST